MKNCPNQPTANFISWLINVKLFTLLLGLLFSFYAYSQSCEQALTFNKHLHKVQGVSRVTLHTYAFENPDRDKAIVIAPGLGDASELLEESIQELYNAGYSVFVMDHRGQGRSVLQQGQRNSHVDNYQNYIADFDAFVKSVVRPTRFNKLYLLGSSMGGAIGFLYLKRHPEVVFKKAIFISPMYGLKAPAWVTNIVAGLGAKFQGPEGSFFTNVHPPLEKSITSDERRYQEYEGFFQANSEIPGYAPSHNWMREANRMMADVHKTRPDEVKTPILVFSAGKDHLVDNKKIKSLVRRFPNMEIEHLPESRHAPHFERNEIRAPLLNGVIQFFQ